MGSISEKDSYFFKYGVEFFQEGEIFLQQYGENPF